MTVYNAILHQRLRLYLPNVAGRYCGSSVTCFQRTGPDETLLNKDMKRTAIETRNKWSSVRRSWSDQPLSSLCRAMWADTEVLIHVSLLLSKCYGRSGSYCQ